MGGAWMSLILDLLSALDSGRTHEQPQLLQRSWRVCSGGGAVESIPGLAVPPLACLLSTTGQGAPDGPSSELGLSCSAAPRPPQKASNSDGYTHPLECLQGGLRICFSHELSGALEFWKTAVPRSW